MVAWLYREGIKNARIFLLDPPHKIENHVYHLFVIRCEERDRLASFLKNRGIESLMHYPLPIHRQPPCSALRCDPEGLAHAERHAEECLSIPCHHCLTDADVSRVIEALNDFS